MTRSQLRTLLDQQRVRPDAYTFSEQGADESYVLIPEGEHWLVFYAERGGRSGVKRFASEAEACEHLQRALLADPSTRSR